LTAAILVGYIVHQRIHSRDVNRQLAEVRQEINSLNQEEAQARGILNRPENRDVAEQSDFLNGLFARKALSWTRVFAEMERIVPYDLHVVSMKPEYTKTNDLMLRIVVATGSRGRAVELVRHMEKSNHFRQAEIVAENVTANVGDQTAGPGNIQFDIAAIYLPGVQDTEAAGDEKAGNEQKQNTNSPAKPTATATQTPGAPAATAAAAQAKNQSRPMREKQH
ncbi:MAG: hypothetical protein ACLPND_19755, partial [Candidatus Korobacteraceae bacterium]